MKTKPLTILIVEDEKHIRDMVKLSLEIEGFKIAEAENTKQADARIAQHMPDLILLDWMLPGMSGVEYVKKLRDQANTMSLPIIMLTAKAEENSKIQGLETGVDDYITKPFSPRELIARIKTVLRRGILMSADGVIRLKDLVLNINSNEVRIGDHLLKLTPLEFKLLYLFLKNQDRIFTRDQLLNQVWGADAYVSDRTVDVQIRRLRDALKPYNYHHFITTIHGIGYKFSEKDK